MPPNNHTELKELITKNHFVGACFVSAKTGQNVSNSLDYIVNAMIDRIENKNEDDVEKKKYFKKCLVV